MISPGGAGELIAAFLAALAFDNLLRFELDEDLHQVIGWNALFLRQVLRAHRGAARMAPRQPEHRPRGIIAFYG